MDRWRVLAVDDDHDTLDLIQMTLEGECDVIAISNPMQTPDVLDIFEPDIVVLDVMMPKVSGFQLIEYMKKKPSYKDIPVIFLTAKGAIRDQKYGYTLGASLYLTKPFQPSRLVKNIKLMFDNIGPQRKAKKLTMKEVELRLSLQNLYKKSTGSETDVQPPVGKAAAATEEASEEEKAKWIN